MNSITKYTVVDDSYEKIAVFSSEFTRKLEKLGIGEDAIIKVCAEVPSVGDKAEIEAVEAEIKERLTHWCA